MNQNMKMVAAVCLGVLIGGAVVAGLLRKSGERDRAAGASDPVVDLSGCLASRWARLSPSTYSMAK